MTILDNIKQLIDHLENFRDLNSVNNMVEIRKTKIALRVKDD
jgi:hypothetical protein